MRNKSITDMLSHLTTLTNGWDEAKNIPAIERDIALEKLRALYDTVLEIGRTEHAPAGTAIATPIVTERDESVEQSLDTPAIESHEEHPVEHSAVESFDDALDIDALLGLTPAVTEESTESQTEVEVESAEESIAEEMVEESAEAVDEAPIAEAEPTIEPAVEPVNAIEKVIAEPAPEPEVKSEPEVAVQSTPAPVSESLFGIEDIPVRSKTSRRMISLYNTPTTNEHPEPTPSKPSTKSRKVASLYEPQPATIEAVEEILGSTPESSAPAPAEESVAAPLTTPAPTINEATTQRLGDVLGNSVTVLGDKLAAEELPTTPFNRISDLRKAIGINDKFLMVRDLFDGDNDRYEATIETLNEFEDLDECMIYIVENFAWNPDSEGAKLLISLLERKLS